MKKINLLLLLFSTYITFAQNPEIIDWNADIDYVRTELPKNHYDLFMFKSESDFNNGLDEITKAQSQLSDFEIAIKLQQLIATLGDSHTSLNYYPFLDNNKILPLGLMWFSDGLWVQLTTKKNETILGTKVLKINGYPIDDVIDSLCTISAIDNQASVKKTIPKIFPTVQLLEYFGFTSKPEVKLTLEKNGEIIEYIIHPEQVNRNNMTRVLPDSLPLCYQNQRSPFWYRVQKKDNVLYIQYNKCWSREYPPTGYKGDIQQLPSFSEFQTTIIDTIQQNNFDKVIFDIRFNSGGNSTQGTELVKEFSTIDKINSKGKLYVITGRESYSSAVINIMDFENMTNAILVGEETSGKPNHLGEIRNLQLPSSGLNLQYSIQYFKRTDKDLKTITPDKTIEPNFMDFKNSHDPVYEWILEQ